MLKDIMRMLNPWWEKNAISNELAKPYKRKFFNKITELKDYRQIVILTGLRRVGKTTLLYQTIEKLLADTDSKRIFYFNFDKEVKGLLEILEEFKELTGLDYRNDKIFVFLDEITKLSNWARELKLIYDASPNIKFYISSSSSINLEEEAVKTLGGRYFLINIFPLFFNEFLELSDKRKLLTSPILYEQELKKEFLIYKLRSFPEITGWKDELLIKDYLKTTIIDKIVKSDLPERFKNLNVELLYLLLDLFYKEPGIYLEYDNLSKNLRISKNTLYTHVFYLEFCYLIRIVKNFRPNTLSTKRKLQRVYPYWWNLAYCYGNNEDKILESLISSILDIKYYWRDTGKEVDFLQVVKEKVIPLEVKNKEKIEDRELNNLKYFMNKYGIKESKLVYHGIKKQLEFDTEKLSEFRGTQKLKAFGKKKIVLIPFWEFLLNENQQK